MWWCFQTKYLILKESTVCIFNSRVSVLKPASDDYLIKWLLIIILPLGTQIMNIKRLEALIIKYKYQKEVFYYKKKKKQYTKRNVSIDTYLLLPAIFLTNTFEFCWKFFLTVYSKISAKICWTPQGPHFHNHHLFWTVLLTRWFFLQKEKYRKTVN